MFLSVFLGFCFTESIFLGFLFVAKYFFWVVQKYPTQMSVGLSSPPAGPIIKLIAVWEAVNVSH